MRPSRKLRVALPDAADALDVVKVEVEEATGLAVEPVFQELDHADLVVELQLAGSDAAACDRLAETIGRTAVELEVLSTWEEAPLTTAAAPTTAAHGGPAARALPAATVFDVVTDPLPEVARRAVRDQLPTSQWLPTIDDIAGGDRSYWLLAVPVVAADGTARVGVRRRHGYSQRFSANDAALLHLQLAA